MVPAADDNLLSLDKYNTTLYAHNQMIYGIWHTKIEFDCKDYFGFLYIITNKITNRKYVGKKNFRKINGEQSDWQKYISSSKYLKKDIKTYGVDNFSFEIIELANSNIELSTLEEKFQIKNNVLTSLLPGGEKEWYNMNIRGYKFNTTGVSMVFSEDHRKKLSQKQSGKNNSFFGKHHTEEHRLLHSKKMSAIVSDRHHKFGNYQSDESNQKRREAILSKNIDRKSVISPRKGKPRARKIEAEFMEFKSIKDASRFFGISVNSIRHRVNSDQFTNWKYLE